MTAIQKLYHIVIQIYKWLSLAKCTQHNTGQ